MPRHLQLNAQDELDALRLSVATADESGLTISDESVIVADATEDNVLITLPSAVGIRGRVIVVKRIDDSVNSVTVVPDGAETIDGGADADLASQWEATWFVSDGANWLTL